MEVIRALPATWRLPFAGALLAFAGLVATGILAHLLPAARTTDADGLRGFTALDQPRFAPVTEDVAHLADPAGYAAIGATLVLVALLRRRPRSAVAVAVLLVASGVTTRLLKAVVDEPRSGSAGAHEVFEASWPSGHATAAMTLALGAVLVAPAVLRPLVAVAGAVFAAAVSYAILVLSWHLPSDVVGGFMVAAGWSLLAVAALTAADARWPGRARPRRPVPELARDAVRLLSAALVAAGAATAGVLAARTDFAAAHTTTVVGGLAIAALAAALGLSLARALRLTART